VCPTLGRRPATCNAEAQKDPKVSSSSVVQKNRVFHPKVKQDCCLLERPS
jgi:hypothetical protein